MSHNSNDSQREVLYWRKTQYYQLLTKVNSLVISGRKVRWRKRSQDKFYCLSDGLLNILIRPAMKATCTSAINCDWISSICLRTDLVKGLWHLAVSGRAGAWGSIRKMEEREGQSDHWSQRERDHNLHSGRVWYRKVQVYGGENGVDGVEVWVDDGVEEARVDGGRFG